MFRICLDDDCHDIEVCQACERNVLIICFFINALMFGLELYYGLIAHSASLLGDSAHNIGDALIIGGSIFVMGSTMRVKAKVALIKAIIMLSFGLLAMGYVISNVTSGYVPNPGPITIVGIIVLIGNIISALLLMYYRNKDINLLGVLSMGNNFYLVKFKSDKVKLGHGLIALGLANYAFKDVPFSTGIAIFDPKINILGFFGEILGSLPHLVGS